MNYIYMARNQISNLISKYAIKKIITRVLFIEGYKMPRFYGVAYHEPGRCATVIYPIPINYVVRFAMWIRANITTK